MRVVIVVDPPRLPLEDCEIAWPMIALFGRKPHGVSGLHGWTELVRALGVAILLDVS